MKFTIMVHTVPFKDITSNIKCLKNLYTEFESLVVIYAVNQFDDFITDKIYFIYTHYILDCPLNQNIFVYQDIIISYHLLFTSTILI